MNLQLQFSMADHIKFQDFPGLEIKILTLQTVWLTGAEVDPLTRLPRLPLASCCEAPTSHPIINEFIHSIVQNNDHTCIEEMILALAGQVKQLSHLCIRCLHRDSKPWNPVEVTWKIQVHIRDNCFNRPASARVISSIHLKGTLQKHFSQWLCTYHILLWFHPKGRYSNKTFSNFLWDYTIYCSRKSPSCLAYKYALNYLSHVRVEAGPLWNCTSSLFQKKKV